MSVSEIKRAAAELSLHEKGELATWLLDSLPPSSGEDATEESLAEALRRKRELDSGEAKSLSWDEFWAPLKGSDKR